MKKLPNKKERASEQKKETPDSTESDLQYIHSADPLEIAMENHPGLTREEAEEMAEAFGF